MRHSDGVEPQPNECGRLHAFFHLLSKGEPTRIARIALQPNARDSELRLLQVTLPKP